MQVTVHAFWAWLNSDPRPLESDVFNKLSGIRFKTCTALVSLYNRPIVLIFLRVQNLVRFGYGATQVVPSRVRAFSERPERQLNATDTALPSLPEETSPESVPNFPTIITAPVIKFIGFAKHVDKLTAGSQHPLTSSGEYC